MTVLRDPIHGAIPFPEEVRKIVDLPPFQRLHHIKQLAFTYLVYPTAKHTRFSHSIGTWFLARKMIEELSEFEIPEDESMHFFAAALLHDVGHSPFSHVLEDIIFSFDHEKKAEEVIKTTEIHDVLMDEWNVDPERVAHIISEKNERFKNDFDKLFNRMLTGILSPDTLDYLLRDAYMCGVPYGIVDIDRLLHTIMIHPNFSEIMIDDRGIAPVESLLFSRYHMFTAVYLHHTGRIAQRMVTEAVERALKNSLLNEDELLRMKDEELTYKLLGMEGPPSDLMERVMERRLFKRAKECRWKVPFIHSCYDLRTKRRYDLHRLEHDMYERVRENIGDKKFEDYFVLIDIPPFLGSEKEKYEIKVFDRETKRIEKISEENVSQICGHILKSFEKCWKLRVITIDDQEIIKAVRDAWEEFHPLYLPRY
ncbi:MAG: HD domain-containing protein [Candidatus Syntropharchaeia archaeon]